MENPNEIYIKLIESQEIVSDRFINIRRIDPKGGDGFFSLVFTADDISTKRKRKVALKFFNPLHSNDQYRSECFHRESDILSTLKGQRNILPLVQEKTTIHLLLEHKGLKLPLPLMFYGSHLAKCNLRHYIYADNKANYLSNLFYFKEMCKAIQRIRSKELCHRDIRPNNFLIYSRNYVCLSDFGTARYFTETEKPLREFYKSPVGDLRYTAPELLCGLFFSHHHNFCAEIYSLGAILFELFTKSILGAVIFPDTLELINNFLLVPVMNRITVFDGVIEAIAAKRPLPSIRFFNESIPKSLAFEIDKLYQSMAALDYRKRETDFNKIFLRISICMKVANYLKTHDEWKKKKVKVI